MNSTDEEDNGARSPEHGRGSNADRRIRATIGRAVWFLIFWLALAGADPADLVAAAASVFLATSMSMILLPPGGSRRSPVAITRLALRFLSQSVIGGVDVARRALDPRLPLRPGFVTYPVRFPPGMERNTFTSLTSLLPGTVPAGEDKAGLVYHCLDVDQPVVAQLTAEEEALLGTLRHD